MFKKAFDNVDNELAYDWLHLVLGAIVHDRFGHAHNSEFILTLLFCGYNLKWAPV